jgi:hypothetical protein
MDLVVAARPLADRRRAVMRLAALAVAAIAMVTVLLPAAPAFADSNEDHFASRLNAERASAGLPALTQVADLQAVARQHAQEMAANNRLYHNPELGTDVRNWSRLSENVGYGGDAETIHVALMNSAGHRANILDRGVSQVGIGIAWSGTRLWVTQVFRQPTGAAATAAPAPAPTTPPAALPDVCAGAPGAPFTDVPRNAWYVGGVDCAVAKSLANGVTPTTYAPAGTVTRAQMASFVYRILLRSSTAPAGAPDLFGDDAGSPHEVAINVLADRGVLNGTAPGVFSPNAQVTRAQMASMLVRLSESLSGPMKTGGVPFTDIAGSPHATAINKVFTAGITSGTSATTFTPNAGVRRDGMSVFLVRTFGGLSSAGAVR